MLISSSKQHTNSGSVYWFGLVLCYEPSSRSGIFEKDKSVFEFQHPAFFAPEYHKMWETPTDVETTVKKSHSDSLNLTDKEAWEWLYAISARLTTAPKSGLSELYEAN